MLELLQANIQVQDSRINKKHIRWLDYSPHSLFILIALGFKLYPQQETFWTQQGEQTASKIDSKPKGNTEIFLLFFFS